MVPSVSDPKWNLFLNHPGDFPVSDLAAQMFLKRLRQKLNIDNSDATRRRVVSEAYAFFSRNESALREELKVIFGVME